MVYAHAPGEIQEPENPLHLSTAARSNSGSRSRVNIQSARWVNIRSAPTVSAYCLCSPSAQFERLAGRSEKRVLGARSGKASAECLVLGAKGEEWKSSAKCGKKTVLGARCEWRKSESGRAVRIAVFGARRLGQESIFQKRLHCGRFFYGRENTPCPMACFSAG